MTLRFKHMRMLVNFAIEFKKYWKEMFVPTWTVDVLNDMKACDFLKENSSHSYYLKKL